MEAIVDSFCNSTLMVVLLVVSNVIYLWPSYTAWRLMYFELSAYLFSETIISSLHHLCFDGGICFGIDSSLYFMLDTSFALIAIGVTLLTPAIYELIVVKRMKDYIKRGYTVRQYIHIPHTARERRHTDDEERGRHKTMYITEHVLIKHTYADIFITLFTVLIFIMVALFSTSTLIIYGSMLGYIIVAYAIHWILFTTMKRIAFTKRYDPLSLAVAFTFGAISIGIFKFIESIEGRCLHSIWHIFGALTCQTFLMGSTGTHHPWKSPVNE